MICVHCKNTISTGSTKCAHCGSNVTEKVIGQNDNNGSGMVMLGYLAYLFAAIDFMGMFFGYDLTGVPWSPIVAGIIGQALISAGGGEKDSKKINNTSG